MSKTGKKLNWKKFFIFSALTIVLICAGLFVFIYSYGHTIITIPKDKNTVTKTALNQDTLPQIAVDFYKSIIDTCDPKIEIIKVSNSEDTNIYYGIDRYAGVEYKKIFDGRRINIALTGVDSRLGSRYKKADANHVFSILPDEGRIEIISIPRDTEADAGYPDTTTFNKLTVCRASKGRDFYLGEVARIAGLDRIHYYVEFGFSQAMGILEWLGYKDAGSQLQVLRARKGFVQDDFQRTYNQAQFMRQMIFLNFDKFSGLFGDVMLGSGLSMLETNLTKDELVKILRQLRLNGMGESITNISVKVKPSLKMRFKVYDFSNPEVVQEMRCKINEYFTETKHPSDSTETNISGTVETILSEAITKATKDSTDHPTLVINGLDTYFRQRAWMQIHDRGKRDSIREQINILLSRAYEKRGEQLNAKNVRDVIAKEKKFFKFSNTQIDKDVNSVAHKSSDSIQKVIN